MMKGWMGGSIDLFMRSLSFFSLALFLFLARALALLEQNALYGRGRH